MTALKSLVAQDDYGILEMLDRQAFYFYSCLQDYESLQKALEADRNLLDDFICESLKTFNGESAHGAMEQLQSYVKNAPLESCIALARSEKFNDWLTLSSGRTELQASFNASVSERIFQVLKDGIFDNMSCLLELQLLQSDWKNLLLSSNDWMKLFLNHMPNFQKAQPETKHWARLTTHFDKAMRQNNANNDSVALRNYGYIALHSAKVARRQGNNLVAERLTTLSSEIPTTKYFALYEQTKVLFLKSDYTQAMQKANQVLTYVTSVSGFDDLKSKTYLKIARYLKNCPDSEVNNLLGELNPGLVSMEGTSLESSVEVSINFALEKSIENNTIDGRPWFEYSTHYYKQGWRILDDMLKETPSVQAILWASSKIEEVLANNMISDVLQTRKVTRGPFFFLI